ncbi:hypothetical protein SDC9_136546 [bioreactor metagenome]|uniref:Uncharacterized protein n=1 Tax=bioreactor metagenome TaxID=1076179 RepID=A0A645DJJ0_9ZZZZ
MVGQCRIALGGKPFGRFLDLLARQAIDDAGLALPSGQESEQLLAGIVLFHHGIADVRTVEAGQEDACFDQPQALQNLVARCLVGGGRQGNARHDRIAFVQGGQLQVFGAEVVPPLRDAVSFVDGEKRQLAGFVEGVEQGQGALEQQAFGRDVDEVEGAREHGLFDGLRFAPVEGRIEAGSLDAELGQGIDLILHQCDQRRDNDGAAGAEQGGNLVAEAFAAAGRHEDQGVAAAGDVGDDLGLLSAEGGVAEDVAQDVKGAGRGGHAQLSGRMASRISVSPSQHRASPRSSCQSARTQRSTWIPSTIWSWVAARWVWPWMKVV